MMRVLSLASVLIAGLAAGQGDRPSRSPISPSGAAPVWAEAKWPFARDAWPEGRAFRCAEADCGTEVLVSLRAKIGFCNCSVGVADDDEIDRVGDVVLVGPDYSPLAPGKPTAIGNMVGRSRPFVVKAGLGRSRYAIGIAVSAKCDAVVAAVVGDQPISPAVEEAALAQLGAEPVMCWAARIVGLP